MVARCKFAAPAAFVRATRSKFAERRPRCPSCGAIMPPPDEPREEWYLRFGHRTPDGEPCPSFSAAQLRAFVPSYAYGARGAPQGEANGLV